MENFSGHDKTEKAYRSSYTTLAEGQVGWSLYRIWYETERVHESLGYQTPHRRLTNGTPLTPGSYGCR
ncbi:MAG: transposase [Candidatus Omnitrophica bacterium]|nr:transposase [Candidatus Omnitrophota bacterium]